MIGKTIIGTSFGGCVRYQFEGHKNSPDPKRAEVLEAVGVREHSADAMIADFNRGRRQNPELGRAVWHTSISFNPDDAPRLNNAKMLAVARDYLAGMGLDQTQYAIIRHHDKAHPHFHIIANRVGNDGQTISDSHNYKRSEHLLKQLSQQHQLTPVGDKRPERIQAAQLTGADRTKYEIYQAAHQALQSCTSGQQFAERMKAQGIDYQIRKNAAGQQTGISFAKDSYSFKGSEVDRKLSLKGIVAQIAQNRNLQVEQAPPNPSTQRPGAVKRTAESALSEVERKWQADYQVYQDRLQTQNAQIRASNEQIREGAAYLRQNPTVEAAQQIKDQCRIYDLKVSLEKQINSCVYYERNQRWVEQQRQELTRQAGQWFGLGEKAKEAKQKLAYLDNPKGAGLERLMNEKHYDFWLHARNAREPKPQVGFEPRHYEQSEKEIVSLKEFAEQREAKEQQRQAQELQQKEKSQRRGPSLGM